MNDLYDAIMKVWATKDDLDMFFRHYGDHPKKMTEDDVANTLLGLCQLHDMRCEALFTEYKKHFMLDEYRWMREAKKEESK